MKWIKKWVLKPKTEQTEANPNLTSNVGLIGEQAYFNLLNQYPLIWQVLNQHLYPTYALDLNKFNCEYKWVNENSESNLPFDFILNGKSNDILSHLTLSFNNTNTPIILIDIKTTSKKQSHFFRSQSEITKINNLLNTYNQHQIKVFYFVCVMYFEQLDNLNAIDLKNWSIRYYDLNQLQKYVSSSNNDGVWYTIYLKQAYLT